jgi:hypothetical protein
MNRLADEKGLDNWVPTLWPSYNDNPFYTTEAYNRHRNYYSYGGFPDTYFDGWDRLLGGWTNNETAYNYFLNKYNQHKAVSAPCSVTYLANGYSGTNAYCKVNIYLDESIPANSVVNFVLWEDNLTYNGKAWEYVERLYQTQTLTISNAGQAQVINKNFTLNPSWVTSNCGFSVWVQDPSKNVLNGRAVKLAVGTNAVPTSLGRVKGLFK